MVTAAILFSHFTFSLAEEVGAQVQMLSCTCCLFAANFAACKLPAVLPVDCALAVCLACTHSDPALLLVGFI